MLIWVYLLECADGKFYVGSHRGADPEDRVAEHNAGLFPEAWTFNRRPVRLLWAGDFSDPLEAVSFERQMKGWTRAKKIAFVEQDWEQLKTLSRSQTAPAVTERGRFYRLTHPDSAEGGSGG